MKKFEIPVIEVLELMIADVITTSEDTSNCEWFGGDF